MFLISLTLFFFLFCDETLDNTLGFFLSFKGTRDFGVVVLCDEVEGCGCFYRHEKLIGFGLSIEKYNTA